MTAILAAAILQTLLHPEASSQQINLSALGPGRLGLQGFHDPEVLFEIPSKDLDALTLECFGEKVAAGPQNLASEHEGFVEQRQSAGLIHDAIATDIGRHVGHHKIDGVRPDEVTQSLQRLGLGEVALQELDPGNRLHWQQVDRDDAARRSNELGSQLAPAAGRRAQVDADRSAMEQLLLVLDLLELEDGARTPTATARLLDVDVALLALAPTLARTRAPWHRIPLAASDVLDGGDLVRALAARRRHLDPVSFLLADQRTRDRRADREQPVLDVGLVLADDLILRLGAVCGIDEMYRRTEDDFAAGVHRRDVDDLRVRELRLDVADPRFHEPLLLLGRVVLGV